MKIPTMLRGDTPDAITLAMPQDDRLNGSKVEAEYQGVKRVFASVCGGDVLALVYTRDEVRRMRLGTFPVSLTVVTASGAAWTVPADDAKIKITDSPSEVYNCQIQIGGGSSGIEPLGADPSVGDVKDKVNEIISRFGGVASVLALVVAAATAWGAMDVQTATLRDLRLSDEVVTNVTGAAGGGRTESIGTAIEWTDATGCVWRVECAWTNSARPGFVFTMRDDGWWRPYDEEYGLRYNEDNGKWTYVQYEAPFFVDGRADDHVIDFPFDLGSLYRIPYATNLIGRVALTNYLPRTASDVGAYPATSGNQLQNTVNAWQTYWDGDDVRVTVTNYYGQTGMPRLYIEEKMPADDTHEEPWFKTVWDELARWNAFLADYQNVTNHIERDLADRAWGVYDSSTGADSPDGLLQISHEQIMIAGNMGYRKWVNATGNTVWVLCGNSDYVFDSTVTGGVFQIKDDEGNAMLEIVKGSDQSVGATCTNVQFTSYGILVLQYPVSTKPTISYCTNLVNADWQDISSDQSEERPYIMEWHYNSGHYEFVIQTPSTLGKCFFKARHTIQGRNYIRNNSPISVVGGILCTDGIHKIRPVWNNGSVTWEAVP